MDFEFTLVIFLIIYSGTMTLLYLKENKKIKNRKRQYEAGNF